MLADHATAGLKNVSMLVPLKTHPRSSSGRAQVIVRFGNCPGNVRATNGPPDQHDQVGRYDHGVAAESLRPPSRIGAIALFAHFHP